MDTHVLRISYMMKWAPTGSTRESAYEYLNARVPEDLKLELHCLLVTHGTHYRCAANGKPQFPPEDGRSCTAPWQRWAFRRET